MRALRYCAAFAASGIISARLRAALTRIFRAYSLVFIFFLPLSRELRKDQQLYRYIRSRVLMKTDFLSRRFSPRGGNCPEADFVIFLSVILKCSALLV